MLSFVLICFFSWIYFCFRLFFFGVVSYVVGARFYDCEMMFCYVHIGVLINALFMNKDILELGVDDAFVLRWDWRSQ